MKSELTDQEKKELQDIDKFNATTGRQGWHVKDKLFKEQDIARIELINSSLDNVDFQSVKGQESTVSNSKLYQVRFLSGDFSRSRFNNVEFSECEFDGVNFKDAQFVNSTFKSCRADRVKMENVVFHSCVFEDFSDKSGIYTGAQFLKAKVSKPNWHNSSFYHVRFEESEFVGGVIEMSIFGNASIADLKLTDVAVNSCSFSESKIEGLVFNGCRSKGITFGKSEITNLTFIGCDGLDGLNLMNSSCRRLSIEKCKGVSEPKFYLSEISEWSIKESHLSYLYCVESRFLSSGLISNCSIAGANFSKARMEHVTVENSLFADYLVLSGGTFQNLVLKDVSYDKKVEIDDQGITYIDSDRFPSGQTK